MLEREMLGEMENENTHVFCPHQQCAENDMIEWKELQRPGITCEQEMLRTPILAA
jgi:hypothetical protein